MASVFIDIPGVGNVEAKNAATESTLRELVNIMKGVQQNTKNKSGPGGAGGSGIVIIRYPDSYAAATSTTGSPTITVAGGYRVYQWTSSGSITF